MKREVVACWPLRGAMGGALLIVGVAACQQLKEPGTHDAAGAAGTPALPTAATAPIEEWECEVAEGVEPPSYLVKIGCEADFEALSSEPLDASIPGARSGKVVLDRSDGNALYFQNSNVYPIHYEFAAAHLSGGDLPIVPPLSQFNLTEYYEPDRRFILGAVTYYEGPQVWALELSPYDLASAEMLELLYDRVKESAFFGPALAVHPTSTGVEAVAAKLGDGVVQVSTDQLFADIDYQPLNLGASIGRLRFLRATELEKAYVGFQDIVVLDAVPNDISVVMGLITEEFQTPLSHVNVLSQNRGTPNMGLRDATANEALRALEDQWVRLEVGPFEWSVEPATSEEAAAYWEEHRPDAVQIPRMDLETSELKDIEEVVAVPDGGDLRETIQEAIPAFGGKASHYSALAQVPGVPVPKAFGIPVYYYQQFLDENLFSERIAALLEDPTFVDDPATRDEELAALRTEMRRAPVNQSFQDALQSKLASDFADQPTIRFRSSTNAEDLEGFTGAGLYTSKTGLPADWPSVLDAIREVWSSVWFFRAFEERTYRGIDHIGVGMALLVHRSFPDEEANGVALTANPFDTAGLEPGFYVNVQVGENSVVQPDAGVTTDQYIQYFSSPNQPLVFLSHSSLVPEGDSVLKRAQSQELGAALQAVHDYFSPAYGPAAGNTGWYAMDVEFKFDGDVGEEPALFVKQARPHPGRGQ